MKRVFVTLIPLYMAEVALRSGRLLTLEVRGKATHYGVLTELMDGFINRSKPVLINAFTREGKGVDLIYRIRTASRAHPPGLCWYPVDHGLAPYEQALLTLAWAGETP